MKKQCMVSSQIVTTILLLLLFKISFAQTSKDTIKPGKANDPMIVNPGNVNDGMVVKPENPHDGMSVMSDTAFLNKIIMDNKMEIDLSKLGQRKGTTAKVKKIAGIMLTDHTAMLEDLRKLSKGKELIQHDHKSAMKSPVIPNGNDFDAEWAGQMLRMHEAKIAEMETFISLTKNTAFKAVVLKAIPKIKTHRDMLLQIPGAKERSKAKQTV